MATPTERSFRFAKWFLIIGAVVGIHPFLIVLALLLYSIGLVLLYRSAVDRRVKLLWVFCTLAMIPLAWAIIVGVSWLFGV